jgi:hypothetical protein
MFDSILPAESEPNGGVSSRWLWTVRCPALIYTISLAGEYVAEAHFEALNPLVGLLSTFGPRSLVSLVLLYFFVPWWEEITGICAWSGRGNSLHCAVWGRV